jgi:hypothetical protein
MFLDGDAEPTPAEGMVTVGRFESPVEAQMAKGLLESYGVASFLVGENANSLIQSAFRVWLQVGAEDEATARDVLAQPAGDETASETDG